MRHDHLDAMQQVSFPDINSSPTAQVIAAPCKNTPIPGVPDVPGAVDPKTTTCLTPPRPVLWCKSFDGTQKNQTLVKREEIGGDSFFHCSSIHAGIYRSLSRSSLVVGNAAIQIIALR